MVVVVGLSLLVGGDDREEHKLKAREISVMEHSLRNLKQVENVLDNDYGACPYALDAGYLSSWR